MVMGKKIAWKNVVGLSRVKEILNSSIQTNSLGHAYLFAGEVGAGKFAMALELAMTLHCDNSENAPCYQCDSCQKILKNSSPEFNLVFPLELDAKEKKDNEITTAGWEKISNLITERINNPYDIVPETKGGIPVEWIRKMNHSVNRGSISGKINVTVFIDVDKMNAASANTMLKTLEEPPENTLLLLLTSRLNTVLPTIRSRCQLIRFGGNSIDTIEDGLKSEFMNKKSEEEIKIAAQASLGFYGRALQTILGNINTEVEKCAAELLNFCVNGINPADLPAKLENINETIFDGGKEFIAAKDFFRSITHILRILFFKITTGSETYIYSSDVINLDNLQLKTAQIEKISIECEKAIRDVGVRGNTLLILATFVMSVMEIIDEQK